MYNGQQYLSGSQNAALTVAAHLLTERCLADVKRLARDEPLEPLETVLRHDEVLPPRFRALYNLGFAERPRTQRGVGASRGRALGRGAARADPP